MVEIRAFRPADLEELYRICLATGAGGDDASALYRDPRLVGHVYAAPYAVLSPLTVFVAATRPLPRKSAEAQQMTTVNTWGGNGLASWRAISICVSASFLI